MKRSMVIGFAKLLAFVAVATVCTASGWMYHRPEIPAELKR